MGKRNRKRRSRSGRSEPHLPGNVARVFETWEQMSPSLGSNPDLGAEIEKRRIELEKLLAPYDAIAMLGQLVCSEMPRSDTYVESEHSGSAATIEIVAGLLSSRTEPGGTRNPSPPIGAEPLRPLGRLTSEIVQLEGLRRYLGAGGLGEDPLGGVRARAAIGHLMLRNPGWSWQENLVLGELFEPFSQRLRDSLGFDAADAVACSEAATMLMQEQMREHLTYDAARQDEVFAWSGKVFTGWQDRDEPIRDIALDMVWALMHVGDAMVLTSDALAAKAAVAPSSATAFLDALSTPFGRSGPLFRLAERIRFYPYLSVKPDGYFLTVPGNDLWTLRLLFEGVLKGESYSKRRGAWLERHAVEMLDRALQPDEAHVGIMIFDQQQQLGEIDGLLRFGDLAVVIEAKSATMRPGARRGGDALIRHLRDTLTKAAEQTAIASSVLHGDRDGDLRSADGAPVVLGARIREVHPVLVTLDDLSAVAPVIWEIAGSTVLPPGVNIPWTVTRHELELVCETVESPVQFAHFLRRRSRLNQLGGRLAVDELDWWMLYLNGRLYFEEDVPDERVRYLSQTDPLDAWVMYKHGEREEPAEKPTQRLDKETRQFLRTLATERPGGWIAAGCALLDANGDSTRRMWSELRRAQRRAAQRDNLQRGAYRYDTGIEPMLICWVAVSDAGAEQLALQLEHYADQRLEESGLRRVLGIGLAASSRRSYDALLVLDRAKWSLPDGGPERDA